MKVNLEIDLSVADVLVEIRANEMNYEVKQILDNLNTIDKSIVGMINNKQYLLKLKEIKVFYSENKNVFARCCDIYKVKYRLYELEKVLENTKFVRISNTSIINLEYVVNFESSLKGTVIVNMNDGTREFVSRRYLKKIKNILSA